MTADESVPEQIHDLRCVECGGLFAVSPGGGLRCASCGVEVSLAGRTYVFTGASEFYEERRRSDHPLPDPGKGPARRILSKVYRRCAIGTQRDRFFERVIPALRRAYGGHACVLDVGCGRGWEVLTRLGKVTGMDISLAALAVAGEIYGCTLRVDLFRRFPLADNRFDVINASDILGHIPAEKKDAFLKEIIRAAKPGAHFTAFIETRSSFYDISQRRTPELFQKYVVDYHDHVGLEPAGEVLSRLRRLGFRVLDTDFIPISPTYTRAYVAPSMEEISKYYLSFRLYRAWATVAVRSRWLEAATDILFGIVNSARRPFLSANSGIGLLVHAVVDKP